MVPRVTGCGHANDDIGAPVAIIDIGRIQLRKLLPAIFGQIEHRELGCIGELSTVYYYDLHGGLKK